MSALEPIQVELSPFEKLQILRDQLGERQKELEDIESQIRDNLRTIEEQRYLESLSPYYAANPREGLPTNEAVETLNQRRTQLAELIRVIEATLPVIMDQTSGNAPAHSQAPSQAAGPARKVKFDSFDDFVAGK